MKKKITAIIVLLCVATASPLFAQGYSHNNRGNNYYGRSDYYRHPGGAHNRNGIGIAAGVVGGLLLSSALMSVAAPPPPTVVYNYPERTYRQQVVVQQPRFCVEERRIHGEWQVSRYTGRRLWVSFPHSVTQTIQVPCY